MNLLDLYEGREPHQQAIDKLEQRRIEDLEARMDDYARRGDKEGFQKCKAERDSYHKVKEGEVTKTATGLKHRGTYGTEYSKSGVEFAKQKHHADLNKVDKTLTKNLEKGMDIKIDEGSMKQWLWNEAERMDRDRFVANAGEYGMSDEEAAEWWDSVNGVDEAGIGQDIVNKTEKMARATPQSKAGAVASTVKNAAKWLAGKGGPGKEGPTYEQEELDEKLKGLPAKKLGSARDLGKSVRKFRAQRGLEERNAAQKKNSEEVNEYISMGSDKNYMEAEPYKNYKIYVRKKPFGNTGMYTAHTEIDRKEFMGKGSSQEEAVQAIRDRIDFVLNAQKKVTGSSTIDFNVKFATDLLADPRQPFYAKLENVKGQPKLIIAGTDITNDPELLAAGDFKRSALRNQVDDQGRATPLPGIPLTAKSLRAGDWIANGRYTVGNETTDSDGNRVFDLTYHSTAHTKSDKLRLNQPAFTLGTAREVDEGWSDEIVSQRTGRPRTPYSVYIKGKKWRDFETDDHAEAVANKLRAKFEREGRDPSVITIAATDYDKMEEAGFGEFPPKQEIKIIPPKKLKSGETHQGINDYWKAQGQAPIYKTNEAGSPAQQAAIAIAMKKAGKKPKQVDEAGDRVDPILYKALDRMQPGIAGQGQPGDDLFSAARTALATEWGLMALRSEYATATAYTRQLIDLYLAKHGAKQGVAEELDENLRDWFGKEKWVRMDTKGNIKGSCARGSESEGKPKCLPQAKAHALGKKGRASAAQKKRREDPDPERRGKAINVATKVKEDDLDEACWKGYHKEGNKELFGKTVPNCVKNKNESLEVYVNRGECPGCGGVMVAEDQINEKQDACYHKVKSRYKVWPSAYASGALVQCRKKGAANWGNKSESVSESYTSVMKSQGITDDKLLEVARRIDAFAKGLK